MKKIIIILIVILIASCKEKNKQISCDTLECEKVTSVITSDSIYGYSIGDCQDDAAVYELIRAFNQNGDKYNCEDSNKLQCFKIRKNDYGAKKMVVCEKEQDIWLFTKDKSDEVAKTKTCTWIKSENCRQGSCDHYFYCSIKKDTIVESGTKARAQEMCETSCTTDI